jgi:hypothetical protein
MGAYDLRLKVRKPLTRLLIVHVNERMTCASHFYRVIRHRWPGKREMKKIGLVLLGCIILASCATRVQTEGTAAGAVGGALVGGPLELSWAVSWAQRLRSLVVRWTAVIATCAGMAGTSCTTATDALASGHADCSFSPACFPAWRPSF